MTSALIILGIFFIYFLTRKLFADDEDTTKNPSNKIPSDVDTTKLFMKILKSMGCQPELDKDNDIIFQFQGEHFLATPLNNSAFVEVYDLNWIEFPSNSHSVQLIQQAVNKTNCEITIPFIVYRFHENNTMTLSSKYTMLISPEIEGPNVYVDNILRAFFVTKHEFKEICGHYIDRCEIDDTKKRTIVAGFNAKKE